MPGAFPLATADEGERYPSCWSGFSCCAFISVTPASSANAKAGNIVISLGKLFIIVSSCCFWFLRLAAFDLRNVVIGGFQFNRALSRNMTACPALCPPPKRGPGVAIGADFGYSFGKRMKFFCTSLLSPDQLGRHCWTKRTAQSKSHSVRGRKLSETENVSSRFSPH